MEKDDFNRLLETLAKRGVNNVVAGDLVLNKHVEHEIGNVEPNGIGIQINNYGGNATEKDAGKEGNESFPHFGLEINNIHWESVYRKLVEKGYIRSNEVEREEWKYICCGEGTTPKQKIMWHGCNNTLAYVIRNKMEGKWDIAEEVFCLRDNKVFPKSFKTTKPPAKNVCDELDRIFKTN